MAPLNSLSLLGFYSRNDSSVFHLNRSFEPAHGNYLFDRDTVIVRNNSGFDFGDHNDGFAHTVTCHGERGSGHADVDGPVGTAPDDVDCYCVCHRMA